MLNQFEERHWAALIAPLFDVEGLDEKEVYHRTTELRDKLARFADAENKTDLITLHLSDSALLIRVAASDRLLDTQYFTASNAIIRFVEKYAHPTFVDAIRDSYPRCPPKRRGDLLMLLSGQDAKLSAACLRDLVTEHGIPSRMQPRTFWKLRERTEYLPLYVLAFIEHADKDIGEVVNLVNGAISEQHLDAQLLNEVSTIVETKASGLLESAIAQQSTVRANWRLDEDYFCLRSRLAAWLDLIGTIDACNFELLTSAARLEDPLICLHTVSALLRRGHEPDPDCIERAASSRETCTDLHQTLNGYLKRPDLFPSRYANFENFAACDMVRWLLYPAELGYEPKELELAATLEGLPDESSNELHRWCIWRFTNIDDTAYAGISGPYAQLALEEPSPETVKSNDVFSSFDLWDSMSVDNHAAKMMDTLSDWKIDFRSRGCE